MEKLPHPIDDPDEDLVLHRLGAATLDLWNLLPRDIQRSLFDLAVGESPERPPGELRRRVAVFLHDNKAPDLQRGNVDVLERE